MQLTSSFLMSLPPLEHILCTHLGVSKDIRFSSDCNELRNTLASAFQLNPSTLLGLKNQELIYPLSFVSKCGGNHPELFSFASFSLLLNKCDGDQTEIEKNDNKLQERLVIGSRGEMDANPTDKPSQLLDQKVKMSDLSFISELVNKLELQEVGLEAFYLFFEEYANNGKINKESFELFIWDLIPRKLLKQDASSIDSISAQFSNVFLLFSVQKSHCSQQHIAETIDTDTNFPTEAEENVEIVVDFKNLFIGLSLILPVPAVTKFEFAFAVHDSEELGYLHKTKLLLCFRVFVMTFVALCPTFYYLSKADQLKLVELTAVNALQSFLSWADSEDQHTAVQSKYIFTLEQVVTWYKTCGIKSMPFLSLLSTSNNSTMIPEQGERSEEPLTEIDVNKAKLSANDSALSNHNCIEDTLNCDLTDSYDPSQNVNAVFTLEFPNKRFMNIEYEDVKTLDLVVTATRLGEKDSSEIVDCVLSEACSKYDITQAAFNNCIRRLVSLLVAATKSVGNLS